MIHSRLKSLFAPIRIWDWWEFKTPAFLGVAYLAVSPLDVPFEVLWPRLLLVVLALVPVASYVCVINEITDLEVDRLAGKVNAMAGRSWLYQFGWVVVCLAAGVIAAFLLRDSAIALWCYIANWLVFTLYSVPPVRLKIRGAWGVIADACGGQLFPTLWTAALVCHGYEQPLKMWWWSILGLWALVLGLRAILAHQFRDLAADLAAGVGSFAVRLGSDRTQHLMFRMLLPAEVAMFCLVSALSGSWLNLAACMALILSRLLPLSADGTMQQAKRSGSIVFRYYVSWFPLLTVLQLASQTTFAFALAIAHVLVFPGAWGLSLSRLLKLPAGLRSQPAASRLCTDPPPSVSVVIPAYQGRRTISSCLASLAMQEGIARIEIILVESSGDGTADIAERDYPDVIVVRSAERLTAGAARNRGAALATGSYILFLDQDCIVAPDWAARLVAHLRQPGVDAVGGSIGIANFTNLSGAAVYFIEFLSHFPRGGPLEKNPPFLLGCNAGYRAEVLKVLQFPDRTLAEDVIFTESVRKAGFVIAYDPTITVLHHNRRGWTEFFVYARKMGSASADYHAALDRKWIRPFLHLPLLVFPAALAVSPLIAIRLLRSPLSYLALFVLVSPACILGNLAWAQAFRRQALVNKHFGILPL